LIQVAVPVFFMVTETGVGVMRVIDDGTVWDTKLAA
jgi:hypothetical protein